MHTANKYHKISNDPNAFDILESNGLECEDWPPYSPDLNFIENVWYLVDKKKNKIIDRLKKPPKNKEEAFSIVQKAWDLVPNDHVINCYDSFKERLKMVIAKNGDNDFNY